jgi:predicted ATPase/DNA-binding SARP family transcriptional activator
MQDASAVNPPNPFVGRQRELREIHQLLLNTRLITLVGVGGCGKTRLAAEVTRAASTEFQDGVAWVDLAPLGDPALVVNAVAAALALREQPEHPLLETLIAFLKTKQSLLVLDNCEHLLAACRALTDALLQACAEVQILATSREPLALAGENVHGVNPLTLPSASSPQAALESEAVRLFALRAAEVLPGFVLEESNLSAAVRICERLDGLPLAIEFAAARVKILTVHEIAERLDNRFLLLTRSPTTQVPRHQTLRAAMDWSDNLLAPPEQILFHRLAVFAGDFTLDAVEAVCSGAVPPATDESVKHSNHSSAVLDLVSQLAEKSLLIVAQREERTPTRYGMLETVREYAREKLDEANETGVLRDRHLVWCLALAEQARPELFGGDSTRWSTRLRNERDNLHSALRWSIASRQTEVGLTLASALWIAWELWGDYSSGIYWFKALLANTPAGSVAPAVHAYALQNLAAMLYRQGNLERARELAQQSLRMVEGLDAPTISRGFATNLLGVIALDAAQFAEALDYFERARVLYLQETQPGRAAGVLHNLGMVAQRQGQLAAAANYLQERVVIAREIGDRPGLALALNSLGEIEMERGHYSRTESMARESLAIASELGGGLGWSDGLHTLASVALYRGEVEQAFHLATEAFTRSNETGIKLQNAAALSLLGEVARTQGDLARALEHYQQALAIYRELGSPDGIALSAQALAGLELQLGVVDRAAELEHEALALFQTIGNPLYIARGLEGTAEFALRHADPLHAAQFLGAAASLREQAGTPPHLPERVRRETVAQQARDALGTRAFEAALARGRALAVEEVLDTALALTQSTRSESVQAAPRPALEIFGLGGSRVVREGQPLDMSHWTYLKSKELFFYLLSHPAATKTQIGLDLWADASPLQLRRVFHRAMHFVRKALGDTDWITFENERYGLNPARAFFHDVDAFEAQRKRALQMLRGDAEAHAAGIRALQAAVELYGGDFLADIEGGDWILFRREELRQQFLDSLLRLGRHWFDAGDYEQAAATYRRVLAEDDYLEVAHRELMRCLARQGEVRQALQNYRMLTELLQREFNAPPSAQTRSLYERLQRGEQV